MSKRKQLRDHVEFLASRFRRDCPFAATVLRSLAGAMDLDIDGELSREVLDWMIATCRLMRDDVDRIAGEAFVPVVSPGIDPTRN